MRVLLEEELSVATQSACIIEKSDKIGLTGIAVAIAYKGAVHGVGLPELVGELHGEGESQFVILPGLVLEQFVVAHEAIEGGPGDLVFSQEPLFDDAAVNVGFVVAGLCAEEGQDLVDCFQELFGGDFASFALIRPDGGLNAGDPAYLEAVEPGGDGFPGKLSGVAVLVVKDCLADGLDAIADGLSGCQIDGPQNSHPQIGRGMPHHGLLSGKAMARKSGGGRISSIVNNGGCSFPVPGLSWALTAVWATAIGASVPLCPGERLGAEGGKRLGGLIFRVAKGCWRNPGLQETGLEV